MPTTLHLAKSKEKRKNTTRSLFPRKMRRVPKTKLGIGSSRMVATTNPSDRFSETTTVALARSWQPRAAQEVIISAARDSQRAHTTDSLSIGLFAIEFHALQHKFGTHAPLIRKTFFSQIACCKRWPLVVFVTSELLLTPQENHTHLASHTLALPCQEICDYRSFHAKKPCSKCTDLLVERRHWILRAVKKKKTHHSRIEAPLPLRQPH